MIALGRSKFLKYYFYHSLFYNISIFKNNVKKDKFIIIYNIIIIIIIIIIIMIQKNHHLVNIKKSYHVKLKKIDLNLYHNHFVTNNKEKRKVMSFLIQSQANIYIYIYIYIYIMHYW